MLIVVSFKSLNMPIITFSFDTGQIPLSRITKAFAAQNKLLLPDHPETDDELTYRIIKEFIINSVKSAEFTEAQKQINIQPIILGKIP